MAVRSRRLYSANLNTLNATVNIYTVPSGRTLIVRSVTFKRIAAGATDVEVGLRPAGGSGLFFFSRAGLALNESVVCDVPVILDPTDVLVVFITGRCHVHAFGSLLFGEPG